MNRALLYLVWRTSVNGLRFRLSRLRNPRYLVPTLIGAGYFAWLFTQSGFSRASATAAAPGLPTSLGGAFTIFFLLILVMTWVFSGRKPTLHFTEAEVHLLFPAPVARRDLVRYRLVKMQPGAIVSALVLSLFMWRWRGLAAVPCAAAGAYVAWNVFFLHQIGASLTVANVIRHGRTGIRRWIPGFVVIGAIAATLAVSIKPPDAEIEGPGDVFRWFDGLLLDGPGGVILWPLRSVSQLPLASDPVEFLARLAPALGLVALLYLWVVRTDAAFEESELAQSRETAMQRAAMIRGKPVEREGGSTHRAAKPALIPLAADGPAWLAIAWKTFVAQSRQTSPMFFLVLFLILVATGSALVWGVRGDDDSAPGEIVGMLFFGVAVFVCLTASSLFREGLRGDLEKPELVRALPLAGRDMLRGTVGAQVMYAGALEVLLLSAGFAFTLATPPQLFSRMAAGAAAVSAVIVLPAATALSLALNNGLVLMFPAWILPEKGEAGNEARGVEGMGRKIVVGTGRMLAFVILLVAPALFGVAVAAAGISLAGIEALPVAAVVASAVMLAETELMLRLFGRILDRLDPGEEGLL